MVRTLKPLAAVRAAALTILVIGLALTLASNLARASAAAGALPPEPAEIAFEVLRNGTPFGTHTIRLEPKGDELHVFVDIELVAKAAFIPVYRYEHRNHEIWRGGRLVSLESKTNDNGTDYRVTAKAEDGALQVDGAEGRLTFPADTVPSSYWNPATLDAKQLLDTQRGRKLGVAVKRTGEQMVPFAGRETEAGQYAMTGDLKLDLWYSPADILAKIAFNVRDQDISYRMTSATPDAFKKILADWPAPDAAES